MAKGLPWMGDRKTQALVEDANAKAKERTNRLWPLTVKRDSASGGIVKERRGEIGSEKVDVWTWTVAPPYSATHSEQHGPGYGGKWHRNVTITASSSRTIEHKLGRKPEGWIITKCVAAATMDGAIVQDTSATNTTSIKFDNDSTAIVLLDIWIF